MVLGFLMTFWVIISHIWVTDYHQPDCMVSQPRRPQSEPLLSLKLQVSILGVFNVCDFEVLMEFMSLISGIDSMFECCWMNFIKFLYTSTALIHYLIFHVISI